MSRSKPVNPFRYFTPEQREEIEAALVLLNASFNTHPNVYQGLKGTVVVFEQRIATIEGLLSLLKELEAK